MSVCKTHPLSSFLTKVGGANFLTAVEKTAKISLKVGQTVSFTLRDVRSSVNSFFLKIKKESIQTTLFASLWTFWTLMNVTFGKTHLYTLSWLRGANFVWQLLKGRLTWYFLFFLIKFWRHFYPVFRTLMSM